MKRFKYSLLCSAMALAATTANAATYEVVDLGGVENTRHSFGLGVNTHGNAVGISREHFNFPIDFDHLNMSVIETDLALKKEASPTTYENVTFERIENRDLNADTLDYLFSFLQSTNGNFATQQLGDQTGFVTSNDAATEETLFDQFDADVGDMSRSTFDQVNAINDKGWTASSGTARIYYTSYVPNATEDVPEPEAVNIWSMDFLGRRGLVKNGDQSTVVTGPDIAYGGSTFLTDISDSNYVVGYSAISYSPNATTFMEENCATLTDPVNQMNCAISTRNNYVGNGQTFFVHRAYRWKLDDNMQVLEATPLDLSFTPKDTDTRSHLSAGFGVNESGHVVGYSDGFRSDTDFQNDSATREIAVYWDGNTVKTFINQTDDQDRDSRALDVNDNNIAVGYTEQIQNFEFIKKMFVYNADTDTVTYPRAFFNSSESVAYAVNNQNKVVGVAEVDNTVGSTRRKRAFIYDIATDTITNLNSLISCNNPYTIAEARDINNDGVIVGTAIKNVEKLDSQGQVILDSNGAPIMEEVARAVKLVPIPGGAVEDCTVTDDGQPDSYERKGAGFGWLSVICLFGLMTIRRLVR